MKRYTKYVSKYDPINISLIRRYVSRGALS